jgi:hypothetical protein
VKFLHMERKKKTNMVEYITVYKNQKLEKNAGLYYLNKFKPAFVKRFGYEPVIVEGLRPDGDPSDIAGRDGIVYTGKNKGISTQWGFYNRYQKRLPGWTVAAYPGKSSHRTGNAIDFGGNCANSSTAEHKFWREFDPSILSWAQGKASGEQWHATIHVGAYSVPSKPTSGTQRQAASNGVKRRSEPNTKSQEGEMLGAGVIGNFNGFIHGENVSGNDIWFRGTSGSWFWSGGFTDSGTHDLPDLTPQQLSGTQRKVAGGDVKRRTLPASSSPEAGDFLPAGTVGNFVGFIRGENINGNDVWFKGNSGAFFWSGGFTDTGTHDLPDLTPAPTPTPTTPSVPVSNTQRVAGPGGVKRRVEPTVTSPEAGSVLPEGTVGEFVGWKYGQAVNGNDVWFKGVSGNWFWSGGFTDSTSQGLSDLNTVSNLPEKPPIIVAPTPVVYAPPSTAPVIEMVDITAEDFPAWVKFDEDLDTYKADRNATSYEYYKEKYKDKPASQYNPIESHAHWWDDPSKGATHEGIVSYMKSVVDLDVNLVVSANRVTKMIPLNIVAFTTGYRNMYGWKTENDPKLTEDGYKTLGLVHYIVEKKNPHLADEPIRLHSEFVSTSCSAIDVAKVRDYANRFKTGELDFQTGLPTEPQSPSEPVTEPIPVISGGVPAAVFKAYVEKRAQMEEEFSRWSRDLIKNLNN